MTTIFNKNKIGQSEYRIHIHSVAQAYWDCKMGGA